MLIGVMELLNIQMRMVIYWYLIYQKVLKNLLGNIKLLHFIGFHSVY
jgi:hypothetical protein